MIRKMYRNFEAKAPAIIKDEKSFNLFLKRNFGASGSVSDGWKIENDLRIRVNRMGVIIIPDFSIAASDVDKWLDDAIMSLSVGRYTSKLTGDYTVVTYNNVSSRVLGRLPDGKIVLAHARPYMGYVSSLVYKMGVYSRDNIVTFPVEKDAMTEQINKVISDYNSVLEQVKRILEERLRRWCQEHPDCDPDADYIEKYDLENESRNRRTEKRNRRTEKRISSARYRSRSFRALENEDTVAKTDKRSLDRMIKRIFDDPEVKRLTSRVFTDDGAWGPFQTLIKVLSNIEGVNRVSYGDSTKRGGLSNGYRWASFDGGNTNVMKDKIRDVIIDTDFGTLEGEIACWGAGTVEDPLERYDMTLQLWKA